MNKILVTGAGGYIGTTLIPMLLDNDYEVTVIDRFFFGPELLSEHPNLTKVQQDTRKLNAGFFEGFDAVIDLAAISNDPSGELFQAATWEINHEARVSAALMAKEAGIERYILPSSCSIYGFQEDGVIADENSSTNPLTTYAKANEQAELGTLPLADENFTVIVLRQATVYGYSPRMRFDLAINGMTFGAWSSGKLPLMRDGNQWRPMVHVKDTAAAQMFMLTADKNAVNGQIFNVGSEANCYQLVNLADEVATAIPKPVEVEWYGEPDHRSYRVSFNKIEALGWHAKYTARDGVSEIVERLEQGELDKTPKTITLQWYKQLVEWQKRIQGIEIEGGLLDLG